MKIVFLNPPFKGRFSRAQRSPGITNSGTLYYPIWLCYAAGWAEKCGHQIKVIDAPAAVLNEEQALDRMQDFKPGLVILQTTTPTIGYDGELAARIKQRDRSVFVAMVGTHVSATADETLRGNPQVDAVARGEFEETMADLAGCLQGGQGLDAVAGLSYRAGEQIRHNPDRPFTEDLDKYPFVSRIYKEQLDVKNYFFAAARYPMVQIFTSRGCPARCFFCVYPQTFHGHKVRSRSPENIADEFQYIAENMPEVKEIVIEDDTFTSNEAHTQKFCQLLMERNIRMTWNANSRVNMSLETMLLMKKAGCRLVIPGYESGNQNILNAMKKGIRLEQSRAFAINAKRAGLMVHGCFLVGGPGETKQTMEETFRLALELAPDTAQFFPIMVYPGTEAYAWASKEGYISAKNYSEWNNERGGHNTIVDRPGLTARDLNEFCDSARRRYYLRPKYIAKNIARFVINKDERLRLFLSFRTFARHLFDWECQK